MTTSIRKKKIKELRIPQVALDIFDQFAGDLAAINAETESHARTSVEKV